MISVRPAQLGALAAGVILLGFTYLVVGRPLDERSTRLAVNLVSMLIALLAAGGAAYAAARSAGRTRRAWSFLAVAFLSWAGGQGAWAFQEEVLRREDLFPSVADIGFLGFIPLAIVGLASVPGGATTAGARARTMLDGLIIAGSMFIISWNVVLEPLVEPAASIDFPFIVALAYPIGDVLLATWAVILGVRAASGARSVWWLVCAGVLAFLFSDVAFLFLTAKDAYASGTWIDIGWIAGLLAVAVAGITAAHVPHEEDRLQRRTRTLALAIPYVPFAVGIGFIVADLRVGHSSGALIWAFVALSGLVVVRQLLALAENTRLATRLAATNDKLQESERSRTRLLNTITHDLLSPLTPVKLQLGILKIEKPPLAPSQAQSVDVIERNIDLLQRLVMDVKDLARLEEGRLPIRPERVDVAPVIEHAVATFAPIAAARGLSLHSEHPEGLTLMADRERLTQMVYNLVSNALKFTPAGGEVAVGVSADAKGRRIYVRDTGRGLTVEEIAKLFKPFSQVHKPHESPEKGTGLGLFISRAIAEQHGGALWVESAGRGKGSTFFLRLPTA